MKYLSVCSGIEAATVAWHPLGWEPVAFSEIEPFPAAVLAHHYPNVPNWGDMTKYKEWPDATIDLLVGGTPCQSFSVAGLRKGLDDPRGNLMLTYLAIADRYRPKWLVWENVPGVLSSNGGRDFASLLRGLEECGYGFAYRVLDAQFVRTQQHPRAVPQRRRRVFVVGCLGSWQRAAAVLFERHSLQGNPAPSRKTGERVAPCVTNGPPFSRTGNERVECDALVIARESGQGYWVRDEIAGTIDANMGCSGHSSRPAIIAMAHGQANAEISTERRTALTCNHEAPIVAFNNRQDPTSDIDVMQPIGAKDNGMGVCVAFSAGNSSQSRSIALSHDHTPPLRAGASGTNMIPTILNKYQVRRLTPEECERLQGFLPGYTNIPWRGKPTAPDGPRYKCLGNSMATNCMSWIGLRIQMVKEI